VSLVIQILRIIKIKTIKILNLEITLNSALNLYHALARFLLPFPRELLISQNLVHLGELRHKMGREMLCVFIVIDLPNAVTLMLHHNSVSERGSFTGSGISSFTSAPFSVAETVTIPPTS
jgi:hypothetical protein